MITGRKRAPESASIRSTRPWAALIFLLLTGGWAISLATMYDPPRRRLTIPFFETTLRIGEVEEHDGDD